mmetsp:Transcript_21472/g.61540  ORF Transcript_21472/g.61540 Transcript_21472/m.61540 type:complete len:213 (-) Transcript_21472:96-734(-)
MATNKQTSPNTCRSHDRCSPHPDKCAPKYTPNPCVALQGPASPPIVRPRRTAPSCCNCWDTIVVRRPSPQTAQIRTRTPRLPDRTVLDCCIPPTHGPHRRHVQRPPTRGPGDSSAGSSRRPSTRRSIRRRNTAPCSVRCRCTCRGRECRRPLLLLLTIHAGCCCRRNTHRSSRDRGRADGRPQHCGTMRQCRERGTPERAVMLLEAWLNLYQ